MKNQNNLIRRARVSDDKLLKQLWNKAQENKDLWKPVKKLVNQIKDRILKILNTVQAFTP